MKIKVKCLRKGKHSEENTKCPEGIVVKGLKIKIGKKGVKKGVKQVKGTMFPMLANPKRYEAHLQLFMTATSLDKAEEILRVWYGQAKVISLKEEHSNDNEAEYKKHAEQEERYRRIKAGLAGKEVQPLGGLRNFKAKGADKLPVRKIRIGASR